MTSYVGLFLKIHHADGTGQEIADSILRMLADKLVPEPNCPVDLEVEYELEEVAGERPRGASAPKGAVNEPAFPEVLEIDMETGRMRSMSKQQMDAEMNASSDQPRVFKVVATDGIQTKDGAA